MSNKKEFFNKLADLLEEYDVDINAYHKIHNMSDIGEMCIDGEGWGKDLSYLDAETCRKIAEE